MARYIAASVGPADELITATGIVHRVPLLTRDKHLLRSKIGAPRVTAFISVLALTSVSFTMRPLGSVQKQRHSRGQRELVIAVCAGHHAAESG